VVVFALLFVDIFAKIVFACFGVVGGQSRKIAQQFLGEELAMWCERSEHDESQRYFLKICLIFQENFIPLLKI